MGTGENSEVNVETLVMLFYGASTLPIPKSSGLICQNSLLLLISATTSEEREATADLSSS